MKIALTVLRRESEQSLFLIRRQKALPFTQAAGASQNPPTRNTHAKNHQKATEGTELQCGVLVMITKYIREDLSDPCHPCSDTENDMEQKFNRRVRGGRRVVNRYAIHPCASSAPKPKTIETQIRHRFQLIKKQRAG